MGRGKTVAYVDQKRNEICSYCGASKSESQDKSQNKSQQEGEPNREREIPSKLRSPFKQKILAIRNPIMHKHSGMQEGRMSRLQRIKEFQ